MRTSSWPLPIVAATILLVASVSSVAAQTEESAPAEEPAPVTFVTGSTVRQIDHIESGWDEGAAAGPGQVRGYEVLGPAANGRGSLVEQDIEWSDPRLPSKHWMSFDYHLIYKLPEGPEGVNSIVTSNLLVDEAGSWTGTGRAVESDENDDRYSLYTLTGHGAYEGLYALLRGTPGMDARGPWDRQYEGWILEGQLPPFPDTPEPVTTEGMQTFPLPGESPPPRPSAETMAPEELDQPTPASVTGEVGDLQMLEVADPTSAEGRERTELTLWFEQTATDPRLAGIWTQSVVLDGLGQAAEGSLNLWSGTAMLENGGGYWVGPVSGYQTAEDPYPGLQQTQLTGGGAYEGLSALLYHRGEGGLDVLEGLVFIGEFPPLPEALEPSEE